MSLGKCKKNRMD